MKTKLKDETVTVETWAWLGMIVTDIRKIADEGDLPAAADKRLRELANHLQEVANLNRN